MNLWLILLGLTTLADHASTVYFFKHNPNLREGNGLLAKVIAKYGLTGLFVAKAISFGLIALLSYTQSIPVWVLPGLCATYAGVVCWNVYKIRTQK